MMSWRQQNLCKQIGYLEKLDTLDTLIKKNQGFLNKVVESSINQYEISFSDFDIIKNFIDNSSYRVIESLAHFNRDWNMDDQDFELGPILSYIESQLASIVPSSQISNTCIVVPGSGLGRIPYELALKGYGHVHSIEFSGLMYLFNQFVYNNSHCDLKDLSVYPYVHNNSNFQHVNDQARSVLVPQITMPANLSMHLEDFNTFELPDHQHDNIVVVTAFFIDTAENLMDYLDSINQLVKPFKHAHWINIGPLKYGTAPKVELNMDELAQLRKLTGWKDIHTLNTLQEPINSGENGLYSYATDKKSFWQGYYGLVGWNSCKK